MKTIILLITLVFFYSHPVLAYDTANVNANQQTKELLNYFYSLTTKSNNRVISGQNLSHEIKDAANGYSNFVTKLYDQSGQYPGIIGVDWGTNATIEQILTGNEILIDYWQKGGLVTISAHFANPWTNGDSWDTSTRPYKELYDATLNPQIYAKWRNELDKIASGLSQLQKAGVTVLWRPYHEMTYDSTFWWDIGAYRGDMQPFKNLWVDMFSYFTNTKHLNNLLWVYSTADNDDIQSVTAPYPGPGYVDVVGIDNYDPLGINGEGYEKMLVLGKPFAWTETGHIGTDGRFDSHEFVSWIKDIYPQSVYFLVWHSWPGYKVAIVDNANTQSLMDDPWTLNRAEMPAHSSPVVDIRSLRELLSNFINVFNYNYLVANFNK